MHMMRARFRPAGWGHKSRVTKGFAGLPPNDSGEVIDIGKGPKDRIRSE